MAGPLYRQIAEALRRKIDERVYEPGAQLPTEDQLMEEQNVSRNTVRGAIKVLTTLGVVYTRHGVGTFVTEQVPPIVTTLTTDPETGRGGGEGLVYTAEVARSGREATTGPLTVEVQQANAAVADALKIPEATEVICRSEQRFVDGHAWSWQTSYYPPFTLERAPKLRAPTSFEDGTVAYLTNCGIQQAGYRDSLEVRAPNTDEMNFFDLPADGRIQVVEIYRVTFDQEGKRVRLTITAYRADRNRFVINVGDVPKGGEGAQPMDDKRVRLTTAAGSPIIIGSPT